LVTRHYRAGRLPERHLKLGAIGVPRIGFDRAYRIGVG
jgi:hypothetical protein